MQHLFKTTIDFSFLIKHNLTPDEYIYLYLKYHKLNKTIEDLKLTYDGLFFSLEEKGFLNVETHSDSDTILNDSLRPKAIALFEESDVDTKWLEIFNIYPIKVSDGQGSYRILRTKDHESKQALELKRMYVHLIKNKVGLHEEVVRGLNTYLQVNKHKMTYLVSLDKFIKENMWESYVDFEAEKDKFSIDV